MNDFISRELQADGKGMWVTTNERRVAARGIGKVLILDESYDRMENGDR